MEVTEPSNLESMTTAVIRGMQSNLLNSCSVFSQRGSDESSFPMWRQVEEWKLLLMSQVCVSSGPAISTFQAGMGSVVMDTRQHPPPPPPRDSLCLRQSTVTSTNTNCVNTRDGRGGTRELLIECEICCVRGWRFDIPENDHWLPGI